MADDTDAPSAGDTSDASNFFAPGQPGSMMQNQQQPRHFSFIAPSDGSVGSDGTLRLNQPGYDGSRYYTIQRVNGNGGNGKGDGTAGPHKHSLEESDKIKKNSIHRHFLKIDKEKRKSQVSKHSFCGGLYCRMSKRKRISTGKQMLRLHACQALSCLEIKQHARLCHHSWILFPQSHCPRKNTTLSESAIVSAPVNICFFNFLKKALLNHV